MIETHLGKSRRADSLVVGREKGLKVYWRKLWSCLDDRWYRAIGLWEGLRRLSRIETKFLSNSVEFHFDEYLHSENQTSVEKMKSSTRMLRVHFLLRQFARLTDLDLETCETLREGDEKGGRWKHRFKQGWEKIRADIGECFPSKGHPGGILKKIPRFVFFPFFPLFPSSFLLPCPCDFQLFKAAPAITAVARKLGRLTADF